jgi:hypothetical protein
MYSRKINKFHLQKTTKMFELFEVKFEFPKNQKISTVKIIILSRYRYRPVTIPLPLHRTRNRPSLTVTLPLPYRYPTVT